MTATPDAATPRSTDPPLTVRLVDRLGRALGGRNLSRRRFLGRVAVVGAAVAVDPIRYAIRPGSAYAQVCGDGASCSSGWTAFCCTVNNGANTCPPGSYAAGWWRIDDSPFCFGAARYIIDCNRLPSASCSCRCADGPCDKRRVCCNNFRYGQCNTQISGVTEVVCRVVTCMAPWQWDSSCNRTVRVDNRTRSHNASCLPGRDATPIDIRYQDLGQTGSILGEPVGAERAGPAGGRYRRFRNGTIAWRSASGALAVHGPIDTVHRQQGGLSGPLRYPTTEVRGTGDGTGLVVRYQGGSIYQRTRSVDPVAVPDPVDARYRALGGPTGRLGYPTRLERRSDGSALVRFQTAALSFLRGGAVVEVALVVLAAAEARPEGSPDRVGWPVSAEEQTGAGRLQRFERGIVTQQLGGDFLAINWDLAERYLDAGGPAGPLGRPRRVPVTILGGRARLLELRSGSIYRSATTGARLLVDPVLSAYLDHGGPSGALGLPTSDVAETRGGQTRASFEHGALVIEPDGRVSVVFPRATRSASDLTTTRPLGGPTRPSRSPTDLHP